MTFAARKKAIERNCSMAFLPQTLGGSFFNFLINALSVYQKVEK